MDAKPFCIRFNKLDGVIKICNRIRYLDLSNSYDKVLYIHKVCIKNQIQNIFKWMFVYYKGYILIELTILMLIKLVHQKSVIFVTIGIS